jgi:hypothetical protein
VEKEGKRVSEIVCGQNKRNNIFDRKEMESVSGTSMWPKEESDISVCFSPRQAKKQTEENRSPYHNFV